MQTLIFENSARLADAVSDEIITTLKNKPESLLCMASGHSPKMTCEFFTDKIKKGEADGSRFHFVGLDEWMGVMPSTPGSCYNDFRERIFEPLGVDSSRYHLFAGMSEDPETECRRMDEYIDSRGGIDLMIVGLGLNGHIGFNEPGCDFNARSHVAVLDETTATVGQKYFQSPTKLDKGITIGFAHLRAAKKVILIASGKAQASIVYKSFKGPVTNSVPASIMQELPNGLVMLDAEAAELLQ